MIDYSSDARRQVRRLLLHYEDLGRFEAVQNLETTLQQAAALIERNPDAGLPAPRPYPSLARQNRAWIKVGAYWITYTLSRPPIIAGIFHESADIPNRL